MGIYIAGKITDLPNYKENFQRAEDKLLGLGHICLNPSNLPEGLPYEAYMPICFAMIDACDTIYMLDNWKDSKGAIRELAYAQSKGKKIMYETENCDDCKFVSLREENQLDNRISHMCCKHKVRVIHRSHVSSAFHAFIYPCAQCDSMDFERRG